MNNWIGFQFSTKQSSSRGVTPNRLPEVGSFGFNDNENNFCHKERLQHFVCAYCQLDFGFLLISCMIFDSFPKNVPVAENETFPPKLAYQV